MQEVQAQDGDQHQKTAKLREKDELESGIDTALMSPDANQEVQRHEHDFPKETEEQQVHCQEHTGQRRHRPQEIEVEEPHTVLNLLPRSRHRQQTQQAGQCQQHQAKAV